METICWSPDGVHLYTGGPDGVLRVWRKDGLAKRDPPFQVRLTCWRADVCPCACPDVCVLLVVALLRGQSFGGHLDGVKKLAVSLDMRELVSVGPHGQVFIWKPNRDAGGRLEAICDELFDVSQATKKAALPAGRGTQRAVEKDSPIVRPQDVLSQQRLTSESAELNGRGADMASPAASSSASSPESAPSGGGCSGKIAPRKQFSLRRRAFPPAKIMWVSLGGKLDRLVIERLFILLQVCCS